MSNIDTIKQNVKHAPISLVSRLFNIGRAQWPRVTECWVITLFFKIGSAIGWTILTASFVGQFGIGWLPALFVINAALTIASTFFFEKLIMRVKREILMIVMLIAAAIGLFMASFMYEKSTLGFFALLIFAESVFLSQFHVFIPILVGDRFTPLESQSTFPFIESAESVGGILGGILVGLLAEKVPINAFLYIWILCLICIIFAFVITSSLRMSLPPLPFRVNTNLHRDKSAIDVNQIRGLMRSINKFSFVKGLVVIVLVQWVFMNLLQFQFTKAIEQSVTEKKEQTIAAQLDPSMMKASVLAQVLPEDINKIPINQLTQNEDNNRSERALTKDQQVSLTKKLGEMKGLFSASALIVQMVFASRLITSLGIVGSMLLHPIIMLMSLVGMFLKFGFLSSVITKLNFEITNVIHKNAYFASHYAMPKNIRDQAAEFLEGIVRPAGTMVSMLLILGLEVIFVGRNLTAMIHIFMFVAMGIILITTIRLKPSYTKISRDQLFSDLPYSEQVNAIEVLEQKGHDEVSTMFVNKLTALQEENSNEARFVRMRLINGLGQAKDYSTLPEILDALSDAHPDIRLEAAQALMNFKDIGSHFYSQAFSRFRMIELLKDILKKEQSGAVRNAIIRVFSLIKEPAIVSFLLDILRDSSPEIRADCIYTLGLFHDPNTAYYILPFINDPDSFVRSNAIVSLWQFQKYRPILEESLKEMVKSLDANAIRAGLFALGEVGEPSRVLMDCLNSENDVIRLEAAIALLKCSDTRGFSEIIDHILTDSAVDFEHLRRTLARLKPETRNLLDSLFVHYMPNYLNELMRLYENKALEDMDTSTLEQLRRLYTSIGQHEELFEIEKALKVITKLSPV